MTQIRIDTEHVHEAARRLVTEGNRVAEISQALWHAINSLDTGAWDGISRARAESMLWRVRPEGESVAQNLETLGKKLMRVAATFEEQDHTAARNVGDLGWGEFKSDSSISPLLTPTPSPTSTSPGEGVGEKTLLEKIGGGMEYVSMGQGVFEAASLYTGLAGVTHITGLSGNVLKDATTLGFKNFARDGNDFFQAVSWKKTTTLGAVGEIVSEIGENWHEYDGNPSKMATGIAFDATLGFGSSLFFGAVGTTIGAAIGTAICGPAGTVVGAKLGGIAGGWLGGELAESVENWQVGDDGQELDQFVVEQVDSTLGEFANNVARFFD